MCKHGILFNPSLVLRIIANFENLRSYYIGIQKRKWGGPIYLFDFLDQYYICMAAVVLLCGWNIDKTGFFSACHFAKINKNWTKIFKYLPNQKSWLQNINFIKHVSRSPFTAYHSPFIHSCLSLNSPEYFNE